jgi:hypothetical protein
MRKLGVVIAITLVLLLFAPGRNAAAGSLFIDPGSPWQNAWIES